MADIVWPEALVREIASRRCVLFLGAGVSASAKDRAGNRPKTWSAFLEEAAGKLKSKTDRKAVSKMLREGKSLLALQVIRDHIDPDDYRAIVNANFNAPSFEPSALHEAIFNLDSRVVITTNFDKIYEKFCHKGSVENGFKTVSYYSDDIVDELKSDTRLILKAHGSVDDLTRMIFTRAEYHRAKAENARFYDVLRSIFLTNTVIFIGCGLEDPDIMLLLEEVSITGSSNRPHYALIKKNAANKHFISDWRKTYNISTLQYGPNHDDLIPNMQALVSLVEGERRVRP